MTECEYTRPFSYRQAHVKIIASGDTDYQIARMPWQTPVQKPGVIRKLAVTNNASGVTGNLIIWDQDISNTTPPTAGSAGAALISLALPAAGASGAGGTTVYTSDQLPELYFIGGIAAQASTDSVTVMAEVEYI